MVLKCKKEGEIIKKIESACRIRSEDGDYNFLPGYFLSGLELDAESYYVDSRKFSPFYSGTDMPNIFVDKIDLDDFVEDAYFLHLFNSNNKMSYDENKMYSRYTVIGQLKDKYINV
jgi:hypothetical protein